MEGSCGVLAGSLKGLEGHLGVGEAIGEHLGVRGDIQRAFWGPVRDRGQADLGIPGGT